MILPSIFLWRSKRKNRISRKKEKKSEENIFAKAEMDANEPQMPDYRMREMPGDMAHELSGDSDQNEMWELPGDMVCHELEIDRHGNEAEELPGDMAHHELEIDRHGNEAEELPGDMIHEMNDDKDGNES